MDFQVHSGSVIGREHTRLWRNNQDGVRTGEITVKEKKYLFGVVCDGCSAGKHNEVGAQLLATYICSEIPMTLLMETPIQDIPQTMFVRSIGYLRGIASQTIMGDPIKMVEFIKNHLLCTVIGFIMDEENCFVFLAGDGVIVLNDEVIKIDQNNKPMYLAYQLVDRTYLNLQGGELPQSFEIRHIKVTDIQRLAVCSDGIVPEAIDSLWGHANLLALQRKLKVLARKQIPFSDDCTVITVERIQATEGAGHELMVEHSKSSTKPAPEKRGEPE